MNGRDEQKIAEIIQRRRLQVLVHSCIYYELNESIIDDKKFDSLARELVELQSQYPGIAKTVIYSDVFDGFDGSTGFDLPIKDEWVVRKAKYLLRLYDKSKSTVVKVEKKDTKPKTQKRRLF